ncbi:MAG: hypothetical protein RLZZ84_1907, partial [Pseudomonadota bacterium]
MMPIRLRSFRSTLLALLALSTFLALLAIPQAGSARTPAAADPPVVILISIDGFRPDYLQRGVTPHLNALARSGASAAMRP